MYTCQLLILYFSFNNFNLSALNSFIADSTSSLSLVSELFKTSSSLSKSFSAVSVSCELRKVKLRSNLPARVNPSRILVISSMSLTLNSLCRQFKKSPRSPKLISALKILASFSPLNSNKKLYLSPEVVHERLQSRVNSIPLDGSFALFLKEKKNVKNKIHQKEKNHLKMFVKIKFGKKSWCNICSLCTNCNSTTLLKLVC